MKTLIKIMLVLAIISSAYSQQASPKITFIELGSKSCVPCKKMVPVMKALEKKYGDQIKVVFYDVWSKEHKNKIAEYKVRLIPTQIFLDENGKEIHRHEGFYPEKQIDKFLRKKKLKIRN